jgi:hypothetical protein
MDDQKKKLLFVPVVLAALGVPYAVVDGKLMKWITAAKSPAQPSGAMPLQGEPPAQFNSTGVVHQAGPAARLEGPQVSDLAEVIRFDISPRWVGQYWSRVSTVTSELELEGLRVPLVTGNRPDDLAGSLTYYFDKHHNLQRLTFHGTTGDERRLLTLLITSYGFQEQPSLGGGMYVTTWSGKPTSVCRVTLAPVVRAAEFNSQREIALEINRPSEITKLSDEMKQLVERDHHVRRW